MTSFSFRSFCEQKPLLILCFPAKHDDEVDYGADSENTAGQKPQNSRADLPHVKSVNPKTPKKKHRSAAVVFDFSGMSLSPFRHLITNCYYDVKKNFDKFSGKENRSMVGLRGLREIRRKKGYSQLKAAMELCISREALSYYENGKRSPDIDMLIKLSEYFHVSIDYLITGKEFQQK